MLLDISEQKTGARHVRTIMDSHDVEASVGTLRTDRQSTRDVCIVRTDVRVRSVSRWMLVQSPALTGAARAELRAKYTGCLCPRCLGAHDAEGPANTTAGSGDAAPLLHKEERDL